MARTVLDRLQSLPEIFDIRDIEGLGYTHEQARKAAYKWRKSGYVEAASPSGIGRSGLYYNLIKEPRGSAALLGRVVQSLYPSAIVAGRSALNWSGWTTQNQGSLELAVPYTHKIRTVRQLKGCTVVQRKRDWFEVAARHLLDDGPWGIPMLSPGYALADAYLNGGGRDVWKPMPDDIDLDCAEDDDPEEIVENALRAFGAPDALIQDITYNLSRFGYGM